MLPCSLRIVEGFDEAERGYDADQVEDAPTLTAAPSFDLVPILKVPSGKKTARRRKGKKKLTWDEDVLAQLDAELEPFRGIKRRIDAVAESSSFLMLNIDRIAAADLLQSRPIGTFVIYDEEPDVKTALNLSFINQDGNVSHCRIICARTRGIKLEGKRLVFKSISALVGCYTKNNPELPHMLRAPTPQDKPIAWLKPHLNRIQATEALELEPDGSFLIRGGNSKCRDKRGYVLTYVYEGLVQHSPIERSQKGLKALGSNNAFGSVFDLVAFYTVEKSKDLRCKLVIPTNNRPRVQAEWDKTPQSRAEPEIDKDEALAVLYGECDGCFVVRPRSKTGKDSAVKASGKMDVGADRLMLSYIHNQMLHHEPILAKEHVDKTVKHKGIKQVRPNVCPMLDFASPSLRQFCDRTHNVLTHCGCRPFVLCRRLCDTRWI